MKHERTKRAKRIEGISLVVDVAVCSHFARSAEYARLPKGSLASLTHLARGCHRHDFSYSQTEAEVPSSSKQTTPRSGLWSIAKATISLLGLAESEDGNGGDGDDSDHSSFASK